jgi:ribonuclease P protein component
VKRRFRLRRRGDFDRVIRSPRVFSGQALVAFACQNPAGGWRVGVAVSRKVRGAVARNRLRRRLREAARAASLLGEDSGAGERGIGYDVVLIGRPAAVELPLPVLTEEAAHVRRRLARR